jgi:hypothetical protein
MNSTRRKTAVTAAAALLYILAWACFLYGAWGYAFLAGLATWPLTLPRVWQGPASRKGKLIGAALYILLWPIAHPLALWRPPDQRYPLRTATCAIAIPLAATLLSSTMLPDYQHRYFDTLENTVADLPAAESTEARKAAVLNLLNSNPFHAAWWLRNNHAQTFYGPFFRKGEELPFRPERLDTPDGDFLYLHHLEGDPEKPLVLFLHGLEGSKDSFYIRAANRLFQDRGWQTVTMEFRYCSGEINNTQRIYHMGETTDIDFVVRTLAERYPHRPLYLSGVSLGGNVLAKWLGEQGDSIPDNVAGAAVISPPFNPLVSAPDFHKILYGFYTWNFLRTLKPKALAKADQFPDLLDREAILSCEDFYTYDTIVTAKLHGFEDAEDYWRKVGSHQFLDTIRVPTLLLTSADDPFNPPETIPRETADASPWLYPQWADHGGHVGFVSGPTPLRPRFWSEEQTLAFFLAQEHYRNADRQ